MDYSQRGGGSGLRGVSGRRRSQDLDRDEDCGEDNKFLSNRSSYSYNSHSEAEDEDEDGAEIDILSDSTDIGRRDSYSKCVL
jgi:hypothetical protein